MKTLKPPIEVYNDKVFSRIEQTIDLQEDEATEMQMIEDQKTKAIYMTIFYSLVVIILNILAW